MASDEPSGARPGPVVLRIKLRYDDVEAMVHRFAPNVGKSGLFLPTKSLQPLGCEIKFELRLADGTPVLVGLGRVRAVRQPDPAHPRAAFGMAVELTRVTPQSRELILRMLERRRELGLPETALPLPDDIDAARRGDLVDTGVRDAGRGAVPAIPPADAAPQVFTAPRRQSGPVAVAKVFRVEPLAPEAPRRKRPALAELIESASGPIASVTVVTGVDDDIDVGAAVARARLLATGELDGELDALRDAAAAPFEIDVEAASAELARQLGGAPVRRDRSGRWAPPPAIEVKAAISPAPEPEPEPQPEPEPEPPVELRTEPTAALPAVDDPPEPDAIDVEAAQIADEIEHPGPTGETDFDDAEHTQIGAMPVDPDAFAAPPVSLLDSDDDELEEIEDFEIIAEADVADADLLEPPPLAAAPADEAAQRPSFLDFAARLDLGDDSDFHTPAPAPAPEEPFAPARPLSVGQALASFDDPDDDGVHEFDEPHGNDRAVPSFIPPGAFDQSDVIAIEPARAPDDVDLETALEALDVDLDDLSIAPPGTERIAGGDPRQGRVRTIDVATARRSRRPPRATTEDGIVIDLDEDE